MTRKPRTTKALWAGLGVMAVVFVYHLATSSVVFRVPLIQDDHSGEPRFVLLNPFRNRGPEKAADQALLSIKNGHCKETVESALDMDPERRTHICGMFKDLGLADWELRNRKDSGNESELYYWHDGYPSLWVYVRKTAGTWKVTWINVIG